MSITANSAQIANGIPSPGVSKNNPWDYYGRCRTVRTTYKTTGLETTGSVITMMNLPPNCKVRTGKLITGALGTGATASVGLVNGFGYTEDGNSPSQTQAGAATGTEFANAVAVATAGTTTIAATQAQNTGYLIANPPAATLGQANIQPLLGDSVIITTGGATYASGIVIVLDLDIVVD